MKARDPRVRQAAKGIGIVIAVSVLFVGFQFGRFLPGLTGEWFARMGGMLTTPFFMEFGIFVMGFVLLLTINHWRQKREGDEFVYLEEVRDAPGDMPKEARSALYREQPLEPLPFPEKDRLEGAIEIGDFDQAGEILAAMSDGERTAADVMRLRIRLARATGREELAARLEKELSAVRSG